MKLIGNPKGRPSRRRGFTLVEMGIVLVIVGIILSIGTASWMMVMDARKMSKTYGDLRRGRNCILNWAAKNGMYPRFTADFDASSSDPVNNCLSNRYDAWGERIYFIEGVRDGAATSLSADNLCFAPVDGVASTDPCHSSNVVKPASVESAVTDKDGNTIERVAFVLVSFGEDGTADDTSYGNLFGANVHAATLDITDLPDFTDTGIAGAMEGDGTYGDDQYVVVTYEDLLAEVLEGRE